MTHRSYLFSLQFAYAIRDACFHEKYSRERFVRDLWAGITVGIIAIPLAMALAIASGVEPQMGLYTAIIGGLLIAATGGSRFSVSGPTAAFVIILFPITQKFGVLGLSIATIMSGFILLIIAAMRLGRFIEYVPEAVVIGFTMGIAIVIALLQLKDFFGLEITHMPENIIEKIYILSNALPDANWPSFTIASTTVLTIFLWRRYNTSIPAHLPALIFSSLIALFFNQQGLSIETIGSRFTYTLSDGSTGFGIPASLPLFHWPWTSEHNTPDEISWQLIIDLAPSAFAIAILGAIESLICAVALDNMSGKRHSANSELLGQGIGNIIVPFFGGITATAALARSAANFKAGAQSPVSAIIHSLTILVALLFFTPLLNYLCMPALAGLLVVVAWDMSELPRAKHLIKTANMSEIIVFVTCLFLTVFVDMVTAITVGILLTSIIFMKEIADMTKVIDISDDHQKIKPTLPYGWSVLQINGPLFFAAADRAFGEIASNYSNAGGIIISMEGVPMLDSGGVSAMSKLINNCEKANIKIMFTNLQFQPLKTLAKSNMEPIEGVSSYFPSLNAALEDLEKREPENAD